MNFSKLFLYFIYKTTREVKEWIEEKENLLEKLYRRKCSIEEFQILTMGGEADFPYIPKNIFKKIGGYKPSKDEDYFLGIKNEKLHLLVPSQNKEFVLCEDKLETIKQWLFEEVLFAKRLNLVGTVKKVTWDTPGFLFYTEEQREPLLFLF